MEAVKFDLNSHLPIINKWRLAYDLQPIMESSTPKLGYITYKEGKPLAAVFIRLVEGGYGQMDGLIRDKSLSKEEASVALDLCVNKAIESAKEAGISGLMAYTRDRTTMERSFKHGWVKLDQAIIVMDLK